MKGCSLQKQGYVHSIDTGGMVDGPGVRYVVFFAGCSLRCKYCHNPDTWKLKDGHLISVGDILRDVKKYKSYLKYSGGGVTVTGGDPLVQPDFLEALLAACKADNLHTVLDTSGSGPRGAAERALRHTDLMLLDIKSIDPDIYKELTGGSLERSLDVLRLSERMGVTVWLRYVLVPGYTDNMEDIRKLADFLRSFPNIERVEVLPFHKMGEYKWTSLGIPYELADVQPPSRETVEKAKAILGIT
jgi:pyruvate formate lyase activating enzyme